MSKKLSGALAGTALAVGAALGLASLAQADTTPGPATTATPSAAPSTGHRHGMRDGGDHVNTLATKLGVSEQKLRAAMESVHKAHEDERRDATVTHEDREQRLAADLAKELGLDQAAVVQALQAERTERAAGMTQRLNDRLDQAVKDGTLTRAEADAVLKAAKAGVVGDGHKGGRH